MSVGAIQPQFRLLQIFLLGLVGIYVEPVRDAKLQIHVPGLPRSMSESALPATILTQAFPLSSSCGRGRNRHQ